MKVSEVQLRFVKPHQGIIAFASVVVGGALYLGSIAVHEKLSEPGSYRITYPTRSIGSQSLQVFHPIKREMGQAIEAAILQKLKDVMTQANDRHCSAYA